MYEEFLSKGVEIVNGPHWSEGWSEMTIRDNNGYCSLSLHKDSLDFNLLRMFVQ